MNRFGLNKALWVMVAALTLVAAVSGIAHQDIYLAVVSDDIMPGVMAQDLMAIMASIVILVLTFRVRSNGLKGQVAVLGLVSFIFYGYGIYSIERIYNSLYLLYIAITGLSFYTIAIGVLSIRPESFSRISVPGPMRWVAAGFALFIATLFVAKWTSELLPLMQTGKKLEFTYSVFVLDLCFVMPLFAILAISATRKHGLGLLMLPALFVKGFTVLFPLAVIEVLKRLYGPFQHMTPNMQEACFYFALSLVFIALAGAYLKSMRSIPTEGC